MRLLQCEQALATYPHWSVSLAEAPRVERRLTGGLTNTSYLVVSSGQKFVLRMHHPYQTRLGIDRVREAYILAAISPHKIAPTLVYLSPDHRFSVLSFVDGRPWSSRTWRRRAHQQSLAEVIETYRGVTIDLPRFDYVAHLKMYWWRFARLKSAEARGLSGEFDKFMLRLKCFSLHTPDFRLVHHDLVPGNIIDTDDGIRIIDWEYAGLGNAVLDSLALNRMQVCRSGGVDPVVTELDRWLRVLWLP